MILMLVSGLPSASWAVHFKLWPLIDFRRHTAERSASVRLLGPLVSYERTPGALRFAIRPFLLLENDIPAAKRNFAFLYPLYTARREPEREIGRAFGLLTFERRRLPPPDRRSERRFTLFPFVFYRQDPETGRSLSVLPFYADLKEFLGYKRVRTVAFPAYLQLSEALRQRTWIAFPFVGRSAGPLARGWRLWPLFGWEETGAGARFRYFLWPLYVRHELHRGHPEEEIRQILTPLYVRIDSPSRHVRSYGLLFSHAVEREENSESWSFPWPLWVWQRRIDSRETLTLRLAPFYQNRRSGGMRARFYLWPTYRIRTTEDETHWSERRDFLLVMGRYYEERTFSPPAARKLSTLFPLWRFSESNDTRQQGLPALLDALFPYNEVILSLYAPLWRAYGSETGGDGRHRWSLLWDLLSFDGSRLVYPVHIGDRRSQSP